MAADSRIRAFLGIAVAYGEITRPEHHHFSCRRVIAHVEQPKRARHDQAAITALEAGDVNNYGVANCRKNDGRVSILRPLSVLK